MKPTEGEARIAVGYDRIKQVYFHPIGNGSCEHVAYLKAVHHALEVMMAAWEARRARR